MGRLNRVIEIERLEVTKDSFGSQVEQFVTLAKVWAEKLEVNPLEKFSEGAARTVDMSVKQFRFMQREDLDLDETMRVIDDYGVQWGIIGIVKNGRQFVTLQLRKEP